MIKAMPSIAIDYLRRNGYQDMVEHTKLLIRIRREHPAFRYSITEDLYQHVSFEEIEGQALIYKVKDGQEEIWSFFHPGATTLYLPSARKCRYPVLQRSIDPDRSAGSGNSGHILRSSVCWIS